MRDDIRKETKRIDHLGLIAGVCPQIKVIETIDLYVRESTLVRSYGGNLIAVGRLRRGIWEETQAASKKAPVH